MNSAKTLLVVGVLGAIATGSYFVFNRPKPPEPPFEAWTERPKTDLGTIDDRNSTGTSDLNPRGPGGGSAPRYDSGSPMDAGSKGLTPFGSGNRSFERNGSGQKSSGAGGQAEYPNQPFPARPPFPQDTLPNSDPSAGQFGSQGEVSVPSSRPDGGPAAFDSGAAIDRAINDLAATTYGDAMAKARVLMQQDRLAEALAMLSKFYDKPGLSAADHRELNALLDQLAGTVIYSRDYHFIQDRPYIVRGGESLQVIAEAHKVPWQLLAKINGIDDPNNLQPGQRLKVIEGPFQAIINLDRRQLYLMVQNRYAGRFSIDVKGIAREDRTRVRTKNHTGDRFLELSNKVRICGPKHVAVTSGCTFVLSQDDVEDLFDILQVSSDVVILR